jgi:cation diffusion facilitator CzcD-associated flavoprotein CzcO
VIIGTGFSGLPAAIGLQKKNLNDFILLERGSDIGGTWRDNSVTRISGQLYLFTQMVSFE